MPVGWSGERWEGGRRERVLGRGSAGVFRDGEKFSIAHAGWPDIGRQLCAGAAPPGLRPEYSPGKQGLAAHASHRAFPALSPAARRPGQQPHAARLPARVPGCRLPTIHPSTNPPMYTKPQARQNPPPSLAHPDLPCGVGPLKGHPVDDIPPPARGPDGPAVPHLAAAHCKQIPTGVRQLHPRVFPSQAASRGAVNGARFRAQQRACSRCMQGTLRPATRTPAQHDTAQRSGCSGSRGEVKEEKEKETPVAFVK